MEGIMVVAFSRRVDWTLVLAGVVVVAILSVYLGLLNRHSLREKDRKARLVVLSGRGDKFRNLYPYPIPYLAEEEEGQIRHMYVSAEGYIHYASLWSYAYENRPVVCTDTN